MYLKQGHSSVIDYSLTLNRSESAQLLDLNGISNYRVYSTEIREEYIHYLEGKLRLRLQYNTLLLTSIPGTAQTLHAL